MNDRPKFGISDYVALVINSIVVIAAIMIMWQVGTSNIPVLIAAALIIFAVEGITWQYWLRNRRK
jgi:hypothetical protein